MTEIYKESLSIEKAVPEDAEAIKRIQAETWLATYPNEEYGIKYGVIKKNFYEQDGTLKQSQIQKSADRIDLAGDDNQMFVANLNNEIVGFSAPRITDEGRRIGALYVLPDAQGKGVGVRLIEAALNWHGDNDVSLTVATYNDKAIKFYERSGFVIDRRLRNDECKALLDGSIIPEFKMIRRANHSQESIAN